MTFLLTVIGAIVGALIGAELNYNDIEGAIIGGIAGGLCGLVVGVLRATAVSARVRGMETSLVEIRDRLSQVETDLERLRSAGRVATAGRVAPDLGGNHVAAEPVDGPVHGAESPATTHPEATPQPTTSQPVPPSAAGPPPAMAARESAALDIRLSDQVLEAAARSAAERTASGASDSPESAWEAANRHHDGGPGGDGGFGRIGGFLLRGNAIAKIGIAILFTGVSFLAKYAADSGLFPIELRLALIAGVAMALTTLGWRLRENRRGYALVLQGGGIAVLYLTVFAALRLYQLLPASLAGALLVVVAVAAAVLAIGQDARVLAVIGAAGGFAAPVLASTGSGSHVALFSFYLVLNLGILAVSWFKAWRELNLLGFVFTYGIGAAWGARHYHPADFATVEPFLVVFFVLYVVVAVLFALRQPPNLRGYVDSSLVFGVPLATFALQYRLVEPYELGAAYSALLMALFYIGIAAWVLRRRDDGLRLLGEAFLAIGVGFATLAVPLGLDARATAATWALEGAAAVWVGVRQQRLLPRLAGVLLQLAAGVSLFIAYADVYGLAAFFNGRALGMALISLSALLSLWHLTHAGEHLRRFEVPALPFVAAYGMAMWFAIGVLEVPELMPRGERAGALLLWFAVSAGVMRWLSPRLLLAPLAVPAMLLVPVAALLAVLTAEEHSHPLDSVGLLAWPLTGVVVYRLLASRDPDDEPPWFCYLHAAALWLMTAMLTWEAGHQVHSLVGAAGAWRLAAVGLVPAASVALVLRLADRGVSLPGAYPRWYRGLGLGPIAAALGCWVLFACVAHDGNPWPLAYVPVLNPLDTAIGLVLLVLLKWLRCFESLTAEEDGGRRHPRYAWQVVGLLAFLWLNAILARAAHFWGGVPYRMDDLLRSAGYQATLALCWGALGIAFMVAGTRRARRTLWMTGAGLMTLVVLKLLVFDLSNSGTVARIVSFMAIGGLLLLVGYVAPVPPRTEPGDEPPDERKRHAEDAA